MATTETDKAIKEIWKMFKETDRKFKEANEEWRISAKETETRFKDTDAKFKDTDARFKDTDARFKDTDAKFKRTEKLVADLTGKWSKFVEGIITPAALKMFQERGIEVERLSTHIKGRKNGVEMEVDILLINGEYAVLIEVKSTLKTGDVNEHIERAQKFKKVFPEYSNRKVIGAVAGIVIEENADRYAYRQGMYVITQSGETAKILNDKKFKPKIW